MNTPKGFEQAYNMQNMVDGKSHIILDVHVVQDGNDKKQLVPMTDRLIGQHGRPHAITDDAGYFSRQALNGFSLTLSGWNHGPSMTMMISVSRWVCSYGME